MKTRQLLRIFRQAMMAIRANWASSLFIMGAIGLGIAALTVILASMEGAGRKAGELAAKFGPSAINIIGGNLVEQAMAQRPMTLTWEDRQRIAEAMPGAERVSPLLLQNEISVRANGRRHTADTLVGAGAHHGLSWGWYLAEGRDFTEEDIHASESVCFLGTITAERLFGTSSPLGRIVVADDVPLRVIGVLTKQGLVAGDMEFDDRVTVPISTMIRRFNLSRRHLSQLRVTFPETSGPEMMAVYRDQLRGLLRELHHLPPGAPDDFLLVTMQDIMQFVDAVKGSIVLFLGLVAAVAILVGGFTQANLFYLSVTERSVEIGLKKALGASHAAIFTQFLLEAGLLGLGGALLGMSMGATFGSLLSRFDLLDIRLSPGIFLLALAVACAIGCLFGVRPARRAAGLPPVTALKGLA
jgi:putative ABC transport system permease protein